MKAFEFEYEIPPLRAIYTILVHGETEEASWKSFAEYLPSARVRKVTETEPS